VDWLVNAGLGHDRKASPALHRTYSTVKRRRKVQITDDPAIVSELLQNVRNRWFPDSEGRGETIHMSDIDHCITKVFWERSNATNQGPTDEQALQWLIGSIFEMMVTGAVSHVAEESRVYEGVVYTPDYYSDALKRPAELKSTRMYYVPALGQPKYGWPEGWIRRTKGYAKALGVTEFNLAVLFLIPSKLVGKLIRFTQDEVDEFWDEFLAPRRDALKEAFEQELPPHPFSYNDSWECTKCPWQVACQAKLLDKTTYIPRKTHSDTKYLERADSLST
jgi:hypothetical protein